MLLANLLFAMLPANLSLVILPCISLTWILLSDILLLESLDFISNLLFKPLLITTILLSSPISSSSTLIFCNVVLPLCSTLKLLSVLLRSVSPKCRVEPDRYKSLKLLLALPKS